MRKTYTWLVGLLLLALLAAGCNFPASPNQTGGVEPLYTQAAQTVQAQLTQAAAPTATPVVPDTGAEPYTATPTSIIPPGGSADTPVPTIFPTATLPPVFPTPIYPTATPLPPVVITVIVPGGGSPGSTSCDQATFVRDVTVKDGSVFAPGEAFTKVWRVRNSGSCTWSADYRLVFDSGDAMGGKTSFALGARVRPGETMDVSATLRAPDAAGTYRSNWVLQNENGREFGTGSGGRTPLWVQIRVKGSSVGNDRPPAGNYAYDLAANYCEASWGGSGGVVRCRNTPNPANGEVSYVARPHLENGRTENEAALVTVPDQKVGGWITGRFPAYLVKAGDYFTADVGCIYGAKNCDVTFSVDYQIGDSIVRGLGVWREVYDGRITRIDVDLTPLAGNYVTLMLNVTNNGRPADAEAFWLVPSVRNRAVVVPTATAIPWPTATPRPTATPGGPTATPGGPPTTVAPEPYPAAVWAAMRQLANDRGVAVTDIAVVRYQAVEWNDACLGVLQPGVICAMKKVPGYKVILWQGGYEFEAHTNQDGSNVRFATP
jgi:hypothetical protein